MIKVWNATSGMLRVNAENVILKPAEDISITPDHVTNEHLSAGRLINLAVPTVIETEEAPKKSSKKKQESVTSEEISEEVIESTTEVSESGDTSVESSILPADNA